MNDGKFIITKDASIANQMAACGFTLLSAVAGVYTFVNDPHVTFNFESFDLNKVCFTNKINI